MALSSAWRSVLPLWLLWSAACSRAASGDDNAFPFDIEGSSAVGRQDPPETSEPRVALGRLPPAAEKCNAGFFRTLSGECVPCNCNGNSNECLDGSGFCVLTDGEDPGFSASALLFILSSQGAREARAPT
uniref:Laminin subunit alpha 4 n=1 Tax=Piliocolobus tephrosceles TaxID=591936 RepID=A0A8C9IAV6_9PRIM